jgi:hypothetical protein
MLGPGECRPAFLLTPFSNFPLVPSATRKPNPETRLSFHRLPNEPATYGDSAIQCRIAIAIVSLSARESAGSSSHVHQIPNRPRQCAPKRPHAQRRRSPHDAGQSNLNEDARHARPKTLASINRAIARRNSVPGSAVALSFIAATESCRRSSAFGPVSRARVLLIMDAVLNARCLSIITKFEPVSYSRSSCVPPLRRSRPQPLEQQSNGARGDTREAMPAPSTDRMQR